MDAAQLEQEVVNLRGEVEVLRRHVQALLAFVPREPMATGFISKAMQDLNAAAAKMDPEPRTALELALKRMNSLSYTHAYRQAG